MQKLWAKGVSERISEDKLGNQVKMCQKVTIHFQETLRERWLKPWVWNKRCSGEPRKLEMPGTWKFCWGKLQAAKQAHERGRQPSWAALSKAIGVGCLQHLEHMSHHSLPGMNNIELQGLIFVQLDYGPTFHSFLCLRSSFWKANFMLEIYNFPFDFHRD